MPLTAEQRERIEGFCKLLESGSFKQMTGGLAAPSQTDQTQIEGYCCLGVACVYYQQETGKGEWIQPSPMGAYGFAPSEVPLSLSVEASILPYEVAKWYGLPANPGLKGFSTDFKLRAATTVNDEPLADFPRIAQAFRETYLEGESNEQAD